jgi:hypothetical protein
MVDGMGRDLPQYEEDHLCLRIREEFFIFVCAFLASKNKEDVEN